MREINLNRQKLGLEDLLFGVGIVTQIRAGQNVEVTKINAGNLPFDETQTLFEWAQSINLEALGSMTTELQAIYDNLTTIGNVEDNLTVINTLEDNLVALQSLYTNISKLQNIDVNMSKLQNIDTNMSKLQNIDTNMSKLQAIDTDLTKLESIYDNLTTIGNVEDNLTVINTLEDNLVALQSLYTNISKLQNIDVNMSKLQNIDTNMSKLQNIDTNMSKLQAIDTDLTKLESIYDNLTTIGNVEDNLTVINTLEDNLVTLQSLYTNISKLQNIDVNMSKLQNIDTNMSKLQNIDTNMSKLQAIYTDLTKLESIYDNLTMLTAIYNNLTALNNINSQVIPNLTELLLVNDNTIQVAADKLTVATDKGIVAGYKEDVSAMKVAVETIYDTFDDRFLGVKTSDPLLDNDGNILQDGAIYFNSSSHSLKVYGLVTLTWYTIPQLYLSGLLDVTLASITTGDILTWNGTKWVNTRTPSFDSVKLNGGTGTAGTATWNNTELTYDLVLNDNVTLQVGQEEVVYCKNNTLTTIPNGKPVMAVGTNGNSGNILIALHDGAKASAKRIIGVTTQAILPSNNINPYGFVTRNGKVRGLNTTGSDYGETWLDGDILYVKATGALTKVEPLDTELKMPIAFVIHAHSNGTLYVRTTGIDENHDRDFINDLVNIHSKTAKTTPVDADLIPLSDSASTFGIKKLTWANIKATLKTYFDSLYTVASSETIAGIIELATTAEAQAGTDNLRAITPLKLKNSVLGLGQTWQDVTASRVLGTTYTNSTGKPILVNVSTASTTSGSYATAIVGGVTLKGSVGGSGGGWYPYISFVVPNGITYSCSNSSGSPTINGWSELR